MRPTEKIALVLVLLVPLLVATVGWPMFVNWIAGPEPQPTPQVAGAAATSVAAARAVQPTARPTEGGPPTLDPAATRQAAAAGPTARPATPTARPPAAAPAATPRAVAPTPAAPPAPAAPPQAAPAGPPAPAPTAAPPPRPAAAPPAANPVSGADPGQAVSSFYTLVSTHQFDSAAQLWTPRMRSAFPPEQNLHQRFSTTQAIRLQRADVVSQDQSRATVAVDLVESDAQAGQRHFVGTWYLVRGPNGWMLDQPDLRPAP